MKIIWTLIFLVIFVMIGCETPYTGHLGPEGFNGWIESEENGLVCLWNGFDRLCIKTIPGRDGKDGKDGRDGTVVTLALEKIITHTEREIFLLEISRTDMTYHTPLGSVYVPEGQPVEAPEDVIITPIETPEEVPETHPATNTPAAEPPTEEPKTVEPPIENTPAKDKPPSPPQQLPVQQHPDVNDPSKIWHVMYRKDGSRASVFVYPRCFNNLYHNPPLPPCENDYGITEDLFFEISPAFRIEIQGTREFVFDIVNLKLQEGNAVLVDVGGVQGVVN